MAKEKILQPNNSEDEVEDNINKEKIIEAKEDIAEKIDRSSEKIGEQIEKMTQEALIRIDKRVDQIKQEIQPSNEESVEATDSENEKLSEVGDEIQQERKKARTTVGAKVKTFFSRFKKSPEEHREIINDANLEKVQEALLSFQDYIETAVKDDKISSKRAKEIIGYTNAAFEDYQDKSQNLGVDHFYSVLEGISNAAEKEIESTPRPKKASESVQIEETQKEVVEKAKDQKDIVESMENSEEVNELLDNFLQEISYLKNMEGGGVDEESSARYKEMAQSVCEDVKSGKENIDYFKNILEGFLNEIQRKVESGSTEFGDKLAEALASKDDQEKFDSEADTKEREAEIGNEKTEITSKIKEIEQQMRAVESDSSLTNNEKEKKIAELDQLRNESFNQQKQEETQDTKETKASADKGQGSQFEKKEATLAETEAEPKVDLYKESSEALREMGLLDVEPKLILEKLSDGDMEKLQELFEAGDKVSEIKKLFVGKIDEILSAAENFELTDEQKEAIADSLANKISETIEGSVNIAMQPSWLKKVGKMGMGMVKSMGITMGTGAVLGMGTVALGVAAAPAFVISALGLTVVRLVQRNIEKRLATRSSKKKALREQTEEYKKQQEEKEGKIRKQKITEFFKSENIKSELSAVMAIELKMATDQQARDKLKTYDTAKESGNYEEVEGALDEMEKVWYSNAIILLTEKYKDRKEVTQEDVKAMAIVMAKTIAQGERNKNKREELQEELINNKPRVVGWIQKFGQLRSGTFDAANQEVERPAKVSQKLWNKYKTDVVAIALGTTITLAVRSSGAARAVFGAMSGMAMGYQMAEVWDKASEKREMKKIIKMVDDAEKAIEDIDFPSDEIVEYRNKATVVQSRLNLGLFESDPILKARAENFINLVQKKEFVNQESLKQVLASVTKNNEELQSQQDKDITDINKKSKRRQLIAMTGGALLMGATSLFGHKKDEEPTEGLDVVEEEVDIGRPEDTVDIESAVKAEAVVLEQQFHQDHALLMSEAEHDGVTVESIDNGENHSVIYNIGENGVHKYLDQGLRRLVMDNMELDDKFEALDAARAENVLANMRELLLGNNTAGFKVDDIKDFVSYDEESGELNITDYNKFSEFVHNDLFEHANEVIDEKSDVLAYTDNTSVDKWQDMLDTKSTAAIEIDAEAFGDAANTAEANLFEHQYGGHFDRLGTDVKFQVGAEEDMGVVTVGDTKFDIANGEVMAIDGVKLEQPIALDDKFQENFVGATVGKDYGLDLQDLKDLGVVGGEDWQASASDKAFLDNLGKDFIISDKFDAFKDSDFDANYFAKGEGVNKELLEFVKGHIGEKEFDIKTVDVIKADQAVFLNKINADVPMERIFDLRGRGYNFTEDGDDVLLARRIEGSDPIFVKLNNGSISFVVKNNELLQKEVQAPDSDKPLTMPGSTSINISVEKFLNDDGVFKDSLEHLKNKEIAQNRLVANLDDALKSDSLLRFMTIDMDEEYKSEALNGSAMYLNDEQSWNELMDKIADDKSLGKFGQKDNWQELHSVIEKSFGNEKEFKQFMSEHPPRDGETVRDYLGKYVGEQELAPREIMETTNIEVLSNPSGTELVAKGLSQSLAEKIDSDVSNTGVNSVQFGETVYKDGSVEKYVSWVDKNNNTHTAIYGEARQVESPVDVQSVEEELSQPVNNPDLKPEPKSTLEETLQPESKAEPEPQPKPVPQEVPATKTTPEQSQTEAKPTPEAPKEALEETPEPKEAPKPTPEQAPKTAPVSKEAPQETPEPKAEPKEALEETPEPKPEPKAEPEPQPKPVPQEVPATKTTPEQSQTEAKPTPEAPKEALEETPEPKPEPRVDEESSSVEVPTFAIAQASGDTLFVANNTDEFLQTINRMTGDKVGQIPVDTKNEIIRDIIALNKDNPSAKFVLKETPHGTAQIDVYDEQDQFKYSTFSKGALRLGVDEGMMPEAITNEQSGVSTEDVLESKESVEPKEAPEETPEPKPESKAEPEPQPKPVPQEVPATKTTPEQSQTEAKSMPEAPKEALEETPEPKEAPEETPEPKPESKAEPEPQPKKTPEETPEPKPEPKEAPQETLESTEPSNHQNWEVAQRQISEVIDDINAGSEIKERILNNENIKNYYLQADDKALAMQRIDDYISTTEKVVKIASQPINANLKEGILSQYWQHENMNWKDGSQPLPSELRKAGIGTFPEFREKPYTVEELRELLGDNAKPIVEQPQIEAKSMPEAPKEALEETPKPKEAPKLTPEQVPKTSPVSKEAPQEVPQPKEVLKSTPNLEATSTETSINAEVQDILDDSEVKDAPAEMVIDSRFGTYDEFSKTAEAMPVDIKFNMGGIDFVKNEDGFIVVVKDNLVIKDEKGWQEFLKQQSK